MSLQPAPPGEHSTGQPQGPPCLTGPPSPWLLVPIPRGPAPLLLPKPPTPLWQQPLSLTLLWSSSNVPYSPQEPTLVPNTPLVPLKRPLHPSGTHPCPQLPTVPPPTAPYSHAPMIRLPPGILLPPLSVTVAVSEKGRVNDG